MTIGDIRREAPTFATMFGGSAGRLQDAEVVYIHPRRRFYAVEFTAPGGGRFRESYYFTDRRGRGEEKGQANEIDCDFELKGRGGKNRHSGNHGACLSVRPWEKSALH